MLQFGAECPVFPKADAQRLPDPIRTFSLTEPMAEWYIGEQKFLKQISN